jgi:outer membrane receptor protein involved in Fe transport
MPLPVRVCVLVLLLLSFPAVAAAQWEGRPLSDYIEALQRQGLRIIYSSDLVLEEYRVREEPTDPDPEAALREALAPYGLALTRGPGGSLLITRDEAGRTTVDVTVSSEGTPEGIGNARIFIDGALAGVTDASGRYTAVNVADGTHELYVEASGYAKSPVLSFAATGGRPASVSVVLEPAPQPLPEVVVTSSRYNIRYEHPGSFNFLDRDLATRMPDVGDEALRAIDRLPGTSSGGVSTRHHVRGGTQNEQLFLFDGLRLYEPYHMKDFHSIATIIDQNAIAGIDFYSAGYQVRYGDRMSGVIDISMREPPEDTETELGLSFFNTSALSRGRFGGDDRGDWLLSGRRANLDAMVDIINPDYGSPKYQDYLAHVGWELGGHSYLSVNALFSYDKISISDAGGGERANARYKNDILWAKAESSWSENLESRTILSATEIENRRSGTTARPGVISGFVDDTREFRSLALKQDWQYNASARWLLSAGFEVKRLEAEYRYRALTEVSPPFDQILENGQAESRTADLSPRGSQYAAYTELRWRPTDRLTLDAGVRWDQQTYTTAGNDDQTSPRFNLLYRLGERTDLRLAFGEYYQAQEINELQVSDGISEFHPAQRAQHLVGSLTHHFDAGFDLRLEAYQKKYRSLMPRFENLFDPLVLIPELQPDRARIEADSAVAEGVELTLSGGGSRNLSWWASYSWSRVAETAGGETTRRSWDQPHTLGAGLSRDWGSWSFSAAGSWHTGWPRTPLLAEAVADGSGAPQLVASVGPRGSSRYADFHSLDVRVSRSFALPKGDLTAFLEITNLYNRDNPCCTEYTVELDADGEPFLRAATGNWLPLVPSMGVVWRF